MSGRRFDEQGERTPAQGELGTRRDTDADAGAGEAAAHQTPDDGKGSAPGFSQALAELETILRRIEGEETDIDRLAEELSRAAELLELCRAKIRKAEVEVAQIVQDLDGEG